jgi:hypothetical protein
MNSSPTKSALEIMATLRPPSAKPLRLVYGYIQGTSLRYGATLEIESGESVVAPGTGSIVKVSRENCRYLRQGDSLEYVAAYEVTIDHGHRVFTHLKGLSSVTVAADAKVYRGDIIGTPAVPEIFFAVRYGNEWFNPNEINRHFILQDEHVPAQVGKMRFAPDKLVRNLAGAVTSAVHNSVRYFSGAQGFQPVLLNVDFNGNGLKIGTAALGQSSSDYWNIFAPGAFSWTEGGYAGCYACGYGTGAGVIPKFFNKSPQTWLLDYKQVKSSVWLERILAASAASGALTSWDQMLSTWIGGWSGIVPEENFFAVRGLVAGTYRLCLYADTNGRSPATPTTFYVSIDNGTPISKTTSPTAAPLWSENGNYVKFDLTVPAQGVVYVKSYGYFDGLQLERLT